MLAVLLPALLRACVLAPCLCWLLPQSGCSWSAPLKTLALCMCCCCCGCLFQFMNCPPFLVACVTWHFMLVIAGFVQLPMVPWYASSTRLCTRSFAVLYRVHELHIATDLRCSIRCMTIHQFFLLTFQIFLKSIAWEAVYSVLRPGH